MNVSAFQEKSSGSSTLAYCPICYTTYNLFNNKPLIVCQNTHGMCKKCLLTIKSNPRCPFCRETILLSSIRVNKTVMDYIEAKSKKGFQVNNRQNEPDFHKMNERLITEHTNQQGNEALRESYLHESEFISQIRSEIQNHNQIQSQCSLFVLQLYLYFLLLQLSTGILNLYQGFSDTLGDCSNKSIINSSVTLRFELRSFGLLEVLLSVLFIYSILLYSMRMIDMYGLRSFQLALLFITQIKNFQVSIFNGKYLMDERSSCPQHVYSYVKFIFWANMIQLLTGFYFLSKIYLYIFEQ